MWRTQLKSTCSLSQRNLDFFLFPIDIVKCLINVLLVSDSMCVLQSIGFPLTTLASRFSLYFQMLEVCDPLMFPLFLASDLHILYTQQSGSCPFCLSVLVGCEFPP